MALRPHKPSSCPAGYGVHWHVTRNMLDRNVSSRCPRLRGGFSFHSLGWRNKRPRDNRGTFILSFCNLPSCIRQKARSIIISYVPYKMSWLQLQNLHAPISVHQSQLLVQCRMSQDVQTTPKT